MGIRVDIGVYFDKKWIGSYGYGDKKFNTQDTLQDVAKHYVNGMMKKLKDIDKMELSGRFVSECLVYGYDKDNELVSAKFRKTCTPKTNVGMLVTWGTTAIKMEHKVEPDFEHCGLNITLVFTPKSEAK